MVQAGLKNGWESLKAWSDHATDRSSGSSIPDLRSETPSWQGQDGQPPSKGQPGVGFQLQGPGGEAGPKMPLCMSAANTSSQQLRNWLLSSFWGTSQGRCSRRGHMGLGCRDVTHSMVWSVCGRGEVGGRGQVRSARSLGYTCP